MYLALMSRATTGINKYKLAPLVSTVFSRIAVQHSNLDSRQHNKVYAN